jgi:hypothetical protein
MGWQTEVAIQLQAGNTIINQSGVFIYSGTPASGNLVVSIAPAAGTDQFGNTYPKGEQVGLSGDTAQVELLPSGSGGAAEVRFTIPSLSLSNIPNLAGGVLSGSPDYASTVMSGPALAAAGDKDWAQIALFSNNPGSAADALGQLRYINNAQAVTIVLQWDASGLSSAGGSFAVDTSGNLTTGTNIQIGSASQNIPYPQLQTLLAAAPAAYSQAYETGVMQRVNTIINQLHDLGITI